MWSKKLSFIVVVLSVIFSVQVFGQTSAQMKILKYDVLQQDINDFWVESVRIHDIDEAQRSFSILDTLLTASIIKGDSDKVFTITLIYYNWVETTKRFGFTQKTISGFNQFEEHTQELINLYINHKEDDFYSFMYKYAGLKKNDIKLKDHIFFK